MKKVTVAQVKMKSFQEDNLNISDLYLSLSFSFLLIFKMIFFSDFLSNKSEGKKFNKISPKESICINMYVYQNGN